MLGSYRHCCRFCARADRAVKTVREKASLFRSCLPPKREVKHLSSRPSRDQPIADLNGENLLCLSAGRRDQVHAVQSCRWYLQSRNLCSYSGSMFRLSPQKACGCCNDGWSFKKTSRARVRRHADVLQDACCSKEIVLITKAEAKSSQVDVGHGTCRRAQCAPEQDYVGAFIRADLCCDIAKNGF